MLRSVRSFAVTFVVARTPCFISRTRAGAQMIRHLDEGAEQREHRVASPSAWDGAYREPCAEPATPLTRGRNRRC